MILQEFYDRIKPVIDDIKNRAGEPIKPVTFVVSQSEYDEWKARNESVQGLSEFMDSCGKIVPSLYVPEGNVVKIDSIDPINPVPFDIPKPYEYQWRDQWRDVFQFDRMPHFHYRCRTSPELVWQEYDWTHIYQFRKKKAPSYLRRFKK